ncbi:bestrophin family protein [Asticcacaulis tiandongensis]|uniref:bestrophin family protein n=1 Tax=Asticcacaulis tiandongensis TaxID=2565365 RepID=UPI001125BE1E|nr:bestrophin family ion channel [Asticcacaulis tiandongensis]
MIVRPRPTLLHLFIVRRGSILIRIWPQILVVGLLSVLVVISHDLWPRYLPGFSSAPFALLGIALSVFMSFRNGACYDRWWEGRKQWGELIFLTRNLARQALILPEAHRERLIRLTIAFTHALVQHLRPQSDTRPLVRPFVTSEDMAFLEASPNRPNAALHILGTDLSQMHKSGQLNDIPFQLLDKTVSEMALVQAACERIRSTPVPFAYSLLLHRTAYLFCFLMPFAFADTLGWLTPLAVMLVAYTFFGLDALGDELEEPFGLEENDLPLSALATTIELNLREALGETNLPPLPQPVDYQLT